MDDAVTKFKVEAAEREQAKQGASFLERASMLPHGGLFLTKANGERVLAEMPASLLRAMQSVLATIAETGSERTEGSVRPTLPSSNSSRTVAGLSRRPCRPTRNISKKTMPSRVKALLDANVLYSNHLRNLLL
ncbi:hypothetical protein [Bradyrhizobium sp. dw_78]|uniref:hypothetical protein n=1 Tax=Bradyrhizobium sp. dw_78 TaxID=2719793 RepID=UPI001BD1FC96|nr:hypothetical protein [Bradyrhizobium sp. dw_78]